MNAARRAATARQGDVDGFRSQTGVQLCLRQRGAAQIQNSSTFFLAWLICAPISRLGSSSLPSPLSSTVSAPSCPGSGPVFERGGVLGRGETFLRLGDQVVNRLSHESSSKRNGAMTAPFAAMRDELKRAIRQPTQPWLAARWRQSRPSRTARSARTLRSSSIAAFEAGDEHAVADAMLTDGGVDTRDPERAERASCCGGRGRRIGQRA